MAKACVGGRARVLVIFDANQELGDAAAEDLHKKSGIDVSFFKVDVPDGTPSTQLCGETRDGCSLESEAHPTMSEPPRLRPHIVLSSPAIRLQPVLKYK